MVVVTTLKVVKDVIFIRLKEPIQSDKIVKEKAKL
jgi:hypothetical protein